MQKTPFSAALRQRLVAIEDKSMFLPLPVLQAKDTKKKCCKKYQKGKPCKSCPKSH
jgi:hypothetical protein